MEFIIAIFVLVVLLAFIIFPGFRNKLKVLIGGFLNIFVEDMAKTPEGAKAVFQQAIDEVQDRYNKASDTLNRFTGEQTSVKRSIAKLNEELQDAERKCEYLNEKIVITIGEGKGGTIEGYLKSNICDSEKTNYRIFIFDLLFGE